jgi:hypothetical protein
MALLGPPAFDFCIGASVKRRGKVRACGALTSPKGLRRSLGGHRMALSDGDENVQRLDESGIRSD